MYKKGKTVSTQSAVNINQYILHMVDVMSPTIKKVLKSDKLFVNTRVLDDILCDDAKNNPTLIDGKKRWIEINRNIRVRIISTALMNTFGYTLWSGNTRKVFCKPEKKSGFKKASDIKKECLK